MTDVRKLLADALVQAAMEDDKSQKVTVSMRVLEIMVQASQGESEIAVVGEALREELARRGLSQTALAEALGVDKGAVSRIIAGTRAVKIDEAEVIKGFIREAGADNGAGKRLAAARKSMGLSGAELAAAVGISPSAVRAHESGQNGIKSDPARAYAAALGCSAAWLMFGDGIGPDAKGPVSAPMPGQHQALTG